VLCGVGDINSVLGASFYIHCGKYHGNAVAITSTKALTALHGMSTIGADAKLVDYNGQERKVKVIFEAFVELEVDIAVVELEAGEIEFSVFIPVCSERVRLLQPIVVIGMKPGISDDSSVYAARGEVSFIETTVPLFHSTYACHDGLSGAGVIVAVEGGSFHVVGVHVAAHDDTVRPPPIKKKKGGVACADSVSKNSDSTSNSIHGHTAYTLICEVKRVIDIEKAIVGIGI
jgi:hypothetical protein